MKTGKTLVELATEVQRRSEAKRDFIAPVEKLTVKAVDKDIVLSVANGKDECQTVDFPIEQHAHDQLASYLEIPAVYYKKMQEKDPALLAYNANHWLKGQDRRMVRTLDGKVRAVLSDRYRTLENEDLAEAVIPMLLERNLEVMSAEVTSRRLYIKAVDKSIVRTVDFSLSTGRKGIDHVSPGIDLSNSEVGSGALGIFGGLFTGECMNWARAKEAFLRKYHTGNRADVSDEVYAVLTDKTKRLTDAALWSQVQDLVKAALDVKLFDQQVEKLQLAAGQKVESTSVVEVIEKVGRKFNLLEGERKSVLAELIQSGNLTRYGVHAAITRVSADVADYDRASELEKVGGEVIELAPSEWKVLAEAA